MINDTGWDLGYISTPIKEFIDQLSAITGVQWLAFLSSSSFPVVVPEWSLIACALALVMVLVPRNSMEIKISMLSESRVSNKQLFFYSLLMGLGLCFMVTSTSEVFLYFNF